MSDDLVKRLRSVDISWNEAGEYCAEAADLIEVLDKACKEWADVSQRNYQRAKAGESKLQKVIAAFRVNMVMKSDTYTHEAFDALIAELNGDKT